MFPITFQVNWLLVQEKKRKIVFLMLPAKFQVNWPFGPGEEAKNRFPSWISNRNDFNYFNLEVTPMLPSKF